MKRILLTLSFLFMTTSLVAQGFNQFNERNHPYLNWQVAETEHFKIMYPDHLAGIEVEAAAVAEESYRVLSNNLQVEFDRKIRIYLSDEDEISNGFAVTFGNGYTHIWVGVNDYAEIWTGREKWLRKVVAHELAHIFHFGATRTNLGLLNYLIGNPTPGFWAEGLAQYQTEKWDSQRGDRWLRMAIFDSRPDYTDGQGLMNRRLLYASGNSQLRYFTEVYGDSTLAEMLTKRETIFSLLEYHDFDRAFRASTDTSYDQFYEKWRKHMNIYYNSLAAQMDRVDSLQAEPEELPGQYIYDLKYSPDQSEIAVLSLTSLQRPVRRLHIVQNDSARTSQIVADGSINSDITWSPDGTRIAYSRLVRGENSSLLNDIFILDRERWKERRLTHSRRSVSPAFGPDGTELAFIKNDTGTGNVVILDIETMIERQVTAYEGDIQLINLTWNRPRNELVYHRFDEAGDRNLVVLSLESGRKHLLDEGEFDNRMPVISPDGTRIAFTSLRDEVPNVFMTDLDADSTWRVTDQFTGAELLDWTASSGSDVSEQLAVKTSETKRRDDVYLISPSAIRSPADRNLNENYTSWRLKEPERTLSSRIEPDPGLIVHRYNYRSLRNLTHITTFGFPYVQTRNDFGLFALTAWTEPLGKHLLAAAGSLSIGDLSNSTGLFSYVNNQMYPTVTFSAYRSPGRARFYGEDFLVDKLTGAELSMRWPLDRLEGSYRTGRVESRLQFTHSTPYTLGGFSHSPSLPAPGAGSQLSLKAAVTVKKERPFTQNNIHPLDGYGIRLAATGAEKLLGTDHTFLITDAKAYAVLPSFGMQRLYLFGRFQMLIGDPFPQQFPGFSRIDEISLPIEAGTVNFRETVAERVRGYRDFIAGRQVAFGSAEYRMPFLPSLNTSILGFLQLGSTTLTLFADGGAIRRISFSESTFEGEIRIGTGAEIKNLVRIGPVDFVHSLGIAQPYNELFKQDYDLYYRVRASVPF